MPLLLLLGAVCVFGVSVQEHALKLFKRSYVMGDPQKLEDFTVAMKALTEVGGCGGVAGGGGGAGAAHIPMSSSGQVCNKVYMWFPWR